MCQKWRNKRVIGECSYCFIATSATYENFTYVPSIVLVEFRPVRATPCYAGHVHSKKRNVTVWRPSVRPSVCLARRRTHQGQHAMRPAWILARQKGGPTYLLYSDNFRLFYFIYYYYARWQQDTQLYRQYTTHDTAIQKLKT